MKSSSDVAFVVLTVSDSRLVTPVTSLGDRLEVKCGSTSLGTSMQQANMTNSEECKTLQQIEKIWWGGGIDSTCAELIYGHDWLMSCKIAGQREAIENLSAHHSTNK